MRLVSRVGVLLLSLCARQGGAQVGGQDYLSSNTVLVVRHAEKPAEGKGLTAAGDARARAYVHYFEPFHEGGYNVAVDALFAGADSENSIRPRLTLEPLSRTTGLKLNTSINTKDPAALVALLRTQPHGSHPLIAWRHGQIPALLQAFGASPDLIPGAKWPDETYDWVIVLTFNPNGKLQSQKLLTEHLALQ